MLNEFFIVYILFIHFVADFIFQTDEMANGKSEDDFILFHHCWWYLIWMNTFLFPFFAFDPIVNTISLATFVVTNAVIHFFVDHVTSRINKKLWASGNMHNFFVGVGADQFIHAATLIITAKYILGKI